MYPTIPQTYVTRRDGREAEGAPLLREYGVISSIEGSNPSLSATSAFPIVHIFYGGRIIFPYQYLSVYICNISIQMESNFRDTVSEIALHFKAKIFCEALGHIKIVI